MNLLEPVTLTGQKVRLVPLQLDHLDALCAVGLDPELWRWTVGHVEDRATMSRYIQKAIRLRREGTGLPFATVEAATGTVVGSTRFMNYAARDRRVEIGGTWVARPWQRTVVNTEAKYLMFRHAFEVLGCYRVELKTDRLNERSRAAIARIGAVEEGILRKHLITETGRVRDSVFYSVTDDEWPGVKARLLGKLGDRDPG